MKQVLKLDRFKSFVIDMFMIYLPILYIVAYLIFSGKDDFNSTQIAPLIAISSYGLIESIFISLKRQTPGCKAYDILVVNDDGSNLSLFKSIARFFLFLFSCTIILGVLSIFYRKDRKALYDYMLKTKVVYDEK